ncbi:MAG: lysophospholipid acyltransferase family protein [Bacteroidota bacterium]
MAYLVYILILKPLSWLPLSVLYILSDIAYVLVYKIFGYRRSVVIENLTKSFPEKNNEEIKNVASGFYHFFTDMMVETVWLFTLTEKRIHKHFKVKNPELLDKYYEAGKSVILILGHYNSWEMVLSSLNLHVKHNVATIYIPLTSKTFDKVFYKMRTLFGSEMIAKKDFSKRMQEGHDNLSAIIFGADQSPSISKNIYWTQFLNQDTAVAYGVEKYAKKFDMPVIFTKLTRERRGYNTAEFVLITENPVDEPADNLTEMHVRMMEDQILSNPQYWLWSHKRWKKKRDA